LAHGDAEAAANVFLEVLETLSKKSGTDHPSLITPLNNLGVALQTLGNYEAAADILARAADLQSRHFPPTHLSGIETRRNLARNALLSDSPDAKKLIQEVSNHSLMALDLLIREGSEKERLNFLGRFDLISLPCATGNPVIIADVLIASKARLLDAMLSAPEEKTTATWQHIQSTLTPGTAFIDTCRFTTTSVAPEETYGAILILPTGPPQWIPLGSDAELEKWLTAFHNRLAWLSHSLSEKENPGSAPALKLRPILRALYRGFWQPIAEKLPPGTEHIAFSPDSRLHFLPLAALLDSANSPLSSQHLQIATVTSARDLLNAAPQTALSAKPWSVLTLSQFPKSSAPANGDPLLSILSGLQPMPGTKKEAAIISAIAPRDSSFRTGSEATETSLRSASAPAVLHLGCHAFFMPGETSSANLPVDFDENADLLFSGGLVLYNGAKRSPDSPLISSADDLLFPEEIASLPLQGTRLVTLSSCESGAGTPVAGEGLLGLRRAFAIAGAREIAVALWPVADDSTPDFMDRFYRLAIASDRPAQALWQTQAEFLSEAAAEPEAYELAVLRYAPFVLSQNTPLQTGPTIEARKPFPVNPLLLIFGTLPIFLFLSARLFSHKKPT
ncbi:MAG: CHAT domain-containing tetratricopeptide repeat protein, partial [Luteolibacter sp.]